MNRQLITTIAFLTAIGLSGTSFAQRHDDKPHGYDKTKAAATAAGTSEEVKTAGAGGRHDEKPHATGKKAPPAKTAAKPAAEAPAKAPTEAAKTGQ
jgi:hypothetical protein